MAADNTEQREAALRAEVKALRDDKWKVVPLRGKRPIHKDWQSRDYTEADFRGGDNVGVRLGEASDWRADCDMDSPEAAKAGDILLPRTGKISGRASKPSSHFFYRSEGLDFYKKYSDPVDKSPLVELRATPSHQTAVPPSVHPSGERVTWEGDGEPQDVQPELLKDRVIDVAIAALLAKRWPKEGGSRHELALVCAGFLGRAMDGDRAYRILDAAFQIADEEWKDRSRAARETIAKLAKGDDSGKITGGTTFARDFPEGKKIAAAILGWLGSAPEGSLDASPAQDLSAITERAWAAVAERNDPQPRLFLFGGDPARLADRGGRAEFEAMDGDALRNEVAKLTKWHLSGPRGFTEAFPPVAVVANMLAEASPPLPSVNRVIRTPIVAADGAVVSSPGYHAGTKTYYPAPGLEVPAVPESPTAEDVARAVAIVSEMIQDFPFVGPAERANLLAAWLLPYARELVDGCTPLHLIEKPTPGTGATLLVQAITHGHQPTAATASATEEEWKKSLTTFLRAGPSVVLFDNVRRLASANLAKALTDTEWSDRLLGGNEQARLPVRCLWLGTGNNPVLHKEIVRRTVRIRLDAKQERPQLRDKFRIPNLAAWVRERHASIAWAALVIVKNWIASGRRPGGNRALGQYESWSATMGGILEAAGVKGFLDNTLEFYDSSDDESDAVREFLEAWFAQHKFGEAGVADLMLVAFADGSALPGAGLFEGRTEGGLRMAFGHWLKGLADQVWTVAGRQLTVTRCKNYQGAARWKLAHAASTPGSGTPAPEPKAKGSVGEM
jgi:hypothetical protein